MRGALRVAVARLVGARIIPAYAGSTARCASMQFLCQDHPRVCGEHGARQVHREAGAGSSPRMRGARQVHDLLVWQVGIIPAYAGSTSTACQPWLVRWDHPRVCGEHSLSRLSKQCESGSSPRMRGAQTDARLRTTPAGIIPAYAGSTHNGVSVSTSTGDHPRVCGEHPREPATNRPYSGSSPRMRGAPPHAEDHRTGSGIIPAYAGSTTRASRGTPADWDHPRVCGEHRWPSPA